jgi:hypothetical protein
MSAIKGACVLHSVELEEAIRNKDPLAIEIAINQHTYEHQEETKDERYSREAVQTISEVFLETQSENGLSNPRLTDGALQSTPRELRWLDEPEMQFQPATVM